ncbi:lysozyme-like domain-containing protein [Polychytrium aggregatum]|uniref:lysozyme-like domain-containing protein n=1 Tax=Polychytrium aggregatum TaxID=110093 RepID=UPI0022FE7D0E|nr:lysozyme-like domain-containing protein [Polychytrium aggregatum]KAI9205483.1 lysozyme-like domain-containing protein [Polychytrium aggregatum]
MAVREDNCIPSSGNCPSYNSDCGTSSFSSIWPCGKDASGAYLQYFGRGAKQLTYSYNYAPFSQIIYGDAGVLLNDPDQVATSWLSLASAIFFFVFPQSPKPSMLEVIDGTWVPNAADKGKLLGNNFPTTIQIINAECQAATTPANAQNRIDYYKAFAQDLGLDISQENMACAGMGLFGADSSTSSVPLYWDKSWSSQYGCDLVTWQTPFSALITGQYVACVEHNWGVQIS